MAYTTTKLTNDILGPHAATTSTVPTISDLSLMIDGISSQINVVLGGQGVVTLPVTGAQDSEFFTFLGQVNKWGAAAEYLKGLFPEAVGPGESPAFGFWQKKYDDTLKVWRDGKDIPSRPLGGSTDVDPSTYFTRNPDEEEVLGDLSENADRTRMEDVF